MVGLERWWAERDECIVVIRFNGYALWEPVGMKGVGYSGGMVMGKVVRNGFSGYER